MEDQERQQLNFDPDEAEPIPDWDNLNCVQIYPWYMMLLLAVSSVQCPDRDAASRRVQSPDTVARRIAVHQQTFHQNHMRGSVPVPSVRTIQTIPGLKFVALSGCLSFSFFPSD